jgi:hypothetical protein
MSTEISTLMTGLESLDPLELTQTTQSTIMRELNKIQDNLKNSIDPSCHKQGINLLRRLMRSKDKSLFPLVFDNVFDSLDKLLTSEHNDVAELVLTLIQELCFAPIKFRSHEIAEWIEHLIIPILNLCSSHDSPLSKPAFNCWHTITKTYFYNDELIFRLIELVPESSQGICTTLKEMFELYLQKYPQDLIDETDWVHLLQNCVCFLTNGEKELIKFIKQEILKDNFESVLQEIDDEEQVKHIRTIIN